MRSAVLALALVAAACGGSGMPAWVPPGQACTSDVTVHVISRTVSEVDVQFGTEPFPRSIPGFGRAQWRVARANLRDPINLRITKGGMNRPGTPPVTPDHACSDATLVIADPLRYSYFYGAAPLGNDR